MIKAKIDGYWTEIDCIIRSGTQGERWFCIADTSCGMQPYTYLVRAFCLTEALDELTERYLDRFKASDLCEPCEEKARYRFKAEANLTTKEFLRIDAPCSPERHAWVDWFYNKDIDTFEGSDFCHCSYSAQGNRIDLDHCLYFEPEAVDFFAKGGGS